VYEQSDSGEDDESEDRTSEHGNDEIDYVDNEELLVSIRPLSNINRVVFTIDLKNQFIKPDVHQDLQIKEIDLPSQIYQMFLFNIIWNNTTKMMLYYK